MFKYCNSFEPIMGQVTHYHSCWDNIIGDNWYLNNDYGMDLYTTKSLSKQSKQTTNDQNVRPERSTQQAPEAPGSTTIQPERQSEFNSQRQDNENGNEAAIQEKDEQFRDVLQEDDNSNNNDNDQELDEQIEIDKKHQLLFRVKMYISCGSMIKTHRTTIQRYYLGIRMIEDNVSDKINLSNTTNADSVNAEIAADGNNVIITWWERNQTNNEPVVRMSSDNGTTFGSLLKLASDGPIG